MKPFHVITIARVPVFVSIWYLLLLAYYMLPSHGNPGQGMLWAVCVTASLLVHEFGHALVARSFSLRPAVVLHGWGGLCQHRAARSDRDEALIVAAGPAAGLLFGGLVYLAVMQLDVVAPRWRASPYPVMGASFLVWINVIWSLANLLPLWPLDGGQLFRLLLRRWMRDLEAAQRVTHAVGIACAVGVLAVALVLFQSTFLAIIAGVLLFMNIRGLFGGDVAGRRRVRTSKVARGLLTKAHAAFAAQDWRETARLCHQLRFDAEVDAVALDEIWKLLGIASCELERYDEALSYLKKLPARGPVTLARARCVGALRSPEEARSLLEAAGAQLPAETRAALEELCHR